MNTYNRTKITHKSLKTLTKSLTFFVSIFLISPSDYELTKSIRTTVRVSDEDGRSDQTELVVVVLDRNDGAPVFRQMNYQIEIGELNELNTQIYVIEATDEDSGVNGEIIYDIVSAEPTQAKSLFEIDSKSGAIYNTRLVQRQDFER